MRWAAFPIDATPRPIVLLDGRVRIEGGFAEGVSKLAWLAGAVETRVPLPAAVLALLPAQQREGGQTALAITEAVLTEAEFQCDRGLRQLPAYRLRLSGLAGSCVVLSPEVSCWWTANDAEQVRDAAMATVDDDGVTVHLSAFGGVLTQFHRVVFQEHPTCVVARIITSERSVPTGTAVAAVGLRRTILGRLRTPLGGRVLLRTTGQPLAVVPTGMTP